jgi:hypothetical protein
MFKGADEIVRTLKGDDFAGRPDNLGEIKAGVARPGSDIKHAFTDGDTGPLPAVEDVRPPNPVLQSEPLQLLIVGPKDVIAFRCHNEIIAA